MNMQQAKLLRTIAAGFIEACEAAGELGAPGGILYAAMMQQGCTLQQFEGITSGLVKAGMVEKRGECYHATNKGRQFVGLPIVTASCAPAVAGFIDPTGALQKAGLLQVKPRQEQTALNLD